MADRVVETHCSTLFFVGSRVYKRKKPLDLGFADFRTLQARRAACEAEVALNRRLSPDVYLGVATVRDPDDQVCDALVVMRRLPDGRRLSSLATSGADVRPGITRVARDLADLHTRCPAPEHFRHLGEPQALADLWTAGVDALRNYQQWVTPEVLERTRELALRYLAGRGPLLAQRQAEGHLVDGHGDLLADDVFLLDDGPRILDCLEFDQRLRIGDGLLDAAFLAMDLERLGRNDLAADFLAEYRGAAEDRAPVSLEHHFLAYRAHVRAKVACIRAVQSGALADVRAAQQLSALALRHLEAGRVRLVLVGGAPGSGKTTTAHALAAPLAATVLSSDGVRKELHGLSPTASATAPVGEGIYGTPATDRTYAELVARARKSLETGVSVVADATFTSARHRDAMRALAGETHADLTELCCVVDDDVARARMGARVRDASDATPAVRDALKAMADPWPEATVVDAAEVSAALAAVGAIVLHGSGPFAPETPTICRGDPTAPPVDSSSGRGGGARPAPSLLTAADQERSPT